MAPKPLSSTTGHSLQNTNPRKRCSLHESNRFFIGACSSLKPLRLTLFATKNKVKPKKTKATKQEYLHEQK